MLERIHMYNTTNVLQHLEKLHAQIEENLNLVEGLAMAKNLDIFKPEHAHDMSWAIIYQALKLAKHNICTGLVMAKAQERTELISGLVEIK